MSSSIERASYFFPELDSLGNGSGFVDEIYEVVKTIPLFEGFTHQECETLSQHLECFAAPRNASILREGDSGDFLVIILTGQVSVLKGGESGLQKAVALVGPGGIVGEMSLIDGHRRFASCVGIEPTDIAVLGRADFMELLHSYPQLGNKLLMILLQMTTARLRDATTRLLPTSLGAAI